MGKLIAVWGSPGSGKTTFSGACAKFSVNTEEMWYNGIIGREHRKEEKNGKTKEIPVDE